MLLVFLFSLLCCLLPVDCRRPNHQPTRKPETIKRRQTPPLRLPKADDGAKYSLINFSHDIDNKPDSHGDFTMASLTKTEMPRDFTVCFAFIVEAWTTEFSSADLFQLMDDNSTQWGFFSLFASETYTEFEVGLGKCVFSTFTGPHVDPCVFVPEHCDWQSGACCRWADG